MNLEYQGSIMLLILQVYSYTHIRKPSSWMRYQSPIERVQLQGRPQIPADGSRARAGLSLLFVYKQSR